MVIPLVNNKSLLSFFIDGFPLTVKTLKVLFFAFGKLLIAELKDKEDDFGGVFETHHLRDLYDQYIEAAKQHNYGDIYHTEYIRLLTELGILDVKTSNDLFVTVAKL